MTQDRPMRICLVQHRALPVLSEEYKHERIGGEEVQHALLAKALLKAGFDVRLVVGDFGQPDGAVYEGIQTVRSFRTGVGLPILRFIYPRWTKLWQALGRADADAYYLSCAGMEIGLAAMFCKRRKRRLVFRAASDTDCDPEKLLITYARDKRLYEYGLRRADAVLVQTDLQRRLMKANYDIDSEVAGMLFDPGCGPRESACKDIDALWVSNLRDVKRPDRLIELATAMPDVRFHMVGGVFPGQESLHERIKQAAGKLPNMTFHGPVPYRDVAELFERAKLFINTSDVEGFPNTFLQAWSRGIPIVAQFDPDGLIARHGLGAAAESLPQMVQAVHSLLLDAELYRRASEAATRYIAEELAPDEVTAKYINALTDRADGAMPEHGAFQFDHDR